MPWWLNYLKEKIKMLGKKKEDNKRVLRAGNGRRQSSNNKKHYSSNSKRFKGNNNQLPPYMKNNSQMQVYQKKKNHSRLTFIIVIIALIAFVAGAGFGVSLSFDDDNSNKVQLGDTYVENVTQEMLESVLTTIAQISEKILDSNGVIEYVKVVPMTYERDNSDKGYIDKFNKLANEFNSALDILGINTYEIPYPTTTEYSKGYVHYNNVVVWGDLLK